jgi:hypothetical protein
MNIRWRRRRRIASEKSVCVVATATVAVVATTATAAAIAAIAASSVCVGRVGVVGAPHAQPGGDSVVKSRPIDQRGRRRHARAEIRRVV